MMARADRGETPLPLSTTVVPAATRGNSGRNARERRPAAKRDSVGIEWERRPAAKSDSGSVDWEQRPAATGDGVGIEWEQRPTVTGDSVGIEWERRPAATGDSGGIEWERRPAAKRDSVSIEWERRPAATGDSGRTARARCLAAIALSIPLIVQAGCATAGDPAAAQALDAVEQRLLEADVLRVDYVIEASGAVEARLHGDLVAQKPSLAAIAAHGSFAGSDAQLHLIADGERIVGGNGTAGFTLPLPQALHEGLLIGLVRMGVLHNLAMLSGGAPPDATDGSVRGWVETRRTRWFQTNDGTRGIRFDIHVGGEPAGEARLWIDANGLPLRREQIVHFAGGDMLVSEIYEIEAGGIVGPCRFDLARITHSSAD